MNAREWDGVCSWRVKEWDSVASCKGEREWEGRVGLSENFGLSLAEKIRKCKGMGWLISDVN